MRPMTGEGSSSNISSCEGGQDYPVLSFLIHISDTTYFGYIHSIANLLHSPTTCDRIRVDMASFPCNTK